MTDPKNKEDASNVPEVSDTGAPPPDTGDGYPSLDEYSNALEGIDSNTLTDLFYPEIKSPNMLEVYASMQRRNVPIEEVAEEFKEGYKTYQESINGN